MELPKRAARRGGVFLAPAGGGFRPVFLIGIELGAI